MSTFQHGSTVFAALIKSAQQVWNTFETALMLICPENTGTDYYTLTIRDHGFNANLGKAANQDDISLQAIIPWGPKDAA
ncbi:hypothetical protein [Roseovarius sp. MBR-78]|uniref:hypothetical protein n=1 Tax=Roseovarius sp. MBR-78 TaxID=3156460 RepID=UPI00339A7968